MPAHSGVCSKSYPCSGSQMPCSQMINMNCMPPRAIEDSSVAMLPVANARILNRPSENIGFRTRDSMSTNSPSSANPPSSPVSTNGLVQPSVCPPYGWIPYVIAASTAVSPTANVRLPHQSMLTTRRTTTSCSDRYAHTVPRIPGGTLTRNTDRQCHSDSSPPATSPMNEPASAATWLMPSAIPRSDAENASVRIAVELAISIAPPMPCTIRKPISQIAPALPVNGTADSRIEATVNTTKPKL